MKATHRFKETPPVYSGAFGQPIAHPEYVGVSCEECGKSGYIPESSAYVADENDKPIICEECGT